MLTKESKSKVFAANRPVYSILTSSTDDKQRSNNVSLHDKNLTFNNEPHKSTIQHVLTINKRQATKFVRNTRWIYTNLLQVCYYTPTGWYASHIRSIYVFFNI